MRDTHIIENRNRNAAERTALIEKMQLPSTKEQKRSIKEYVESVQKKG